MSPGQVYGVPGLALSRRRARGILGLSPGSEVERVAPAMGDVFAVTSALQLMTAASLAGEAFWEFFLETEM